MIKWLNKNQSTIGTLKSKQSLKIGGYFYRDSLDPRRVSCDSSRGTGRVTPRFTRERAF